jgi:hypothetical protein
MLKARYVVPVLLFALVLCAHFIQAERRRIRRPDFDYSVGAWSAAARSYASRDKIWLGLSLATAAGFVAFWLKRPCKTRKQAVKGAGGGLAMATFLHGIGCFLLGCCGSPMLAVYVGLLGPRFAGLTGPINFGLTVLSIAVSCVWLKRRDQARCSCEAGNCPAEVPIGTQQEPRQERPEQPA